MRACSTRLLGYSATRLLGYSATRLLGYSATRLLGCSLFALFLTASAQAQSCLDGTSYTATSCWGGGSSDLCTVTGGDVTCDLSALTATRGATAYAAYNASSNRYEAFGTDPTGSNFCCFFHSGSVPSSWTFTYIGSDYTSAGDTLALQFDDGSSVHDLRETVGSVLEAWVYAGDGNDTCRGSDRVGGSYSENLYGEDHDDVLHGGAGDDDLWGGIGVDYLYGDGDDDYLRGGSGNDFLYGGDGADAMYGDDQDDYLYGEAGDDGLRGGNGDDALHGGAGDDVLNGENHDDWLSGGDGDDTLCGGLEGGTYSLGDFLYGDDDDDLLWGMNAAGSGKLNEGEGGSGYDECDTSSSPGYSTCEGTLSSAPAQCL